MTDNLNKMSPGALDIIEQATEHLEYLYALRLSGEKYEELQEVLEGLTLVELDDETCVAVLDQLNNGVGSVERAGGSPTDTVLLPSCSTVSCNLPKLPVLTKEGLPSTPAHKNVAPNGVIRGY